MPIVHGTDIRRASVDMARPMKTRDENREGFSLAALSQSCVPRRPEAGQWRRGRHTMQALGTLDGARVTA